MCITKEVSLITFTLCTVASIHLYQRNNLNDRFVAYIFGYIGIMQFLEYLMWTDQECSGLNQIASFLAFYHVIFQPIIILLLIYFLVTKNIPIIICLIFLAHILYVIPELYKNFNKNECSKPCPGSKIGLSWDWAYNTLIVWSVFFLSLATPFLLLKNGSIWFIYALIIWITSGLVGSTRCKGGLVNIPNGSLWCMMAFLGPLFKIYLG